MTISVITPTYNSAKTLNHALDSLIQQSWQNFESVVVDGASTDGSQELLRNRESDFGRRLRWRSEPDAGIYDAINRGIALSTGDIIGVLNADDFFDNNEVLSAIAGAFRDNPELDAVYGDVRFIRLRSRDRAESRRSYPALHDQSNLLYLRSLPTLRSYSARSWRAWMLRWGYMPPHPSIYIRRAVFDRIGGYRADYAISGDFELIIRLFKDKSFNIKYINSCMVAMRPGGKSTKNIISNWILNREIVRANRENGYYTNIFLLMPKYFIKIWEILIPALQSWGARK